MDNPYSDLPPTQFWSDAVTNRNPAALDPLARGEKITGHAKIATLGSCFAQHLSRHIAKAGFTYFAPEQPDPRLSAVEIAARGYGVFSARYGNVYTVRQALQLFQRAFGSFSPADDVWDKNGRAVDAFRPRIEPEGFDSAEAVRAARVEHLRYVRQVFSECDWLILTLGLTESWRSCRDGAVYPLAPGVAGGRFDADRYEFFNATVREVVDDLAAFVQGLAEVNAKAKVILTVSPVALVATYEPRHVLASTVCSKSILRVAADEIERRFGNVIYFPSYEIITSPAAEGRYYADDLRQVNQQGVDHVMRVFSKHFLRESTLESPVTGRPYVLPRSTDIVCDEEEIERAFKRPKLWSK